MPTTPYALAVTGSQIGESMDTEPERAHGREGLFLAMILSLAAFMVGTSLLADYELGVLVAAAVTLVPALVLTFRPSTRSFATGMLIGTVVGIAIELAFLKFFLEVL